MLYLYHLSRNYLHIVHPCNFVITNDWSLKTILPNTLVLQWDMNYVEQGHAADNTACNCKPFSTVWYNFFKQGINFCFITICISYVHIVYDIYNRLWRLWCILIYLKKIEDWHALNLEAAHWPLPGPDKVNAVDQNVYCRCNKSDHKRQQHMELPW